MKITLASLGGTAVVALLMISGFSLAQQSNQKQTTVVSQTDARTVSAESKDSKASGGGNSASANTDSQWLNSVSENTRLSQQLDWIFGGTHQPGWSLYSLLIAQTVGAGDASYDKPEFASHVADWQRQNRLGTTSGVVDGPTWSQFVSYFQSRRIKDRKTSDQLITIPVDDCYDPDRPLELRQVDKATYEAYKHMVAAANADLSQQSTAATANEGLSQADKFFKIISAYRSPEYQAELHKRNPNATSAGLAVNSPHRTGRAIDVYVGGEPVSTMNSNRAIQVSTPAYRWLVKNAARFGFQPYFYEPWHWEYNPQSPTSSASQK